MSSSETDFIYGVSAGDKIFGSIVAVLLLAMLLFAFFGPV